MAKVINIIGMSSNVGKTTLIEGIIKELNKRGLSVSTIKHDCHGFDIDYSGKDTYRHREAGAETVIISSKNRIAMIKEVDEEVNLEEILKMVIDKDVILVEGYKKSKLRKIEVYRDGVSKEIITDNNLLIAIASDVVLESYKDKVKNKNDYAGLVDLILKEKEYIE